MTLSTSVDLSTERSFPLRSAPASGWVIAISLALLASACTAGNPISGATTKEPTVTFVLDAPLCSSVIPVEFIIDKALVSTDTFVVNIAGRDHTASRAFATSIGLHSVSARAVSGYLWPEKQVTISAGQSFVDSLPFYCS